MMMVPNVIQMAYLKNYKCFVWEAFGNFFKNQTTLERILNVRTSFVILIG